MIKIFISIFLFVLSCNLIAQSVSVLKTEKIMINNIDEAMFPRFTKDDSKILFSSSNYKGLYSIDLKTKNYNVISNENGAGYNPLVLENENVLFRTFRVENGKKFHSISSYNASSDVKTNIEVNKRFIKIPTQISNQRLFLIENSQILKKEISMPSVKKTAAIEKAIYVEDNNLILVEGDQSKIVNPLGKGTYVWESLSPNGSEILFTFGNKGAYVCDLEGNILLNIEKAHYPRFSPNGEFISYMIDEDNGYNYVSSDIYVYSIEEQKSFPISATSDKMEMFAEWSNDGEKIVYHTTEGQLFVATIQIKN